MTILLYIVLALMLMFLLLLFVVRVIKDITKFMYKLAPYVMLVLMAFTVAWCIDNHESNARHAKSVENQGRGDR